MKICNYLSYFTFGRSWRLGIMNYINMSCHAIQQEDIYKYGGHLTYLCLPFSFAMTWVYISMFCPQIFLCQALWFGWKPSPKVIWCQKLHTSTQWRWPNFGCHFHYRDNGTRFCQYWTSFLKTIQISCAILAILCTNVWMTFIEIWIESPYSNTTTINTTTTSQFPNGPTYV